MAISGVWKQLEAVFADFRAALQMPAEEEILIPETLKGRSLLSIADLSPDDLSLIFTTAVRLKRMARATPPRYPPLLAHKTLAMVFEKPSLRTRVSFEVGMTQLGGHAINLQPSEIQLGKRESIADAARTLGRMVDGIMARTFAHQTVEELAQHAGVPVINGLSDLEHPCQALADFMTILEKKSRVKGLKIAWVGDSSNVCHSNLLLAAQLGAHFTIACPKGYEPNAQILEKAQEGAAESGSQISVLHSPAEAVRGADVLFTDVWASMGQEEEVATRRQVLAPFQVNQELVRLAAPDCILLHCLPAHRGEEITDEVLDGPHSVVFDEAENRLHVQKALLVLLMA